MYPTCFSIVVQRPRWSHPTHSGLSLTGTQRRVTPSEMEPERFCRDAPWRASGGSLCVISLRLLSAQLARLSKLITCDLKHEALFSGERLQCGCYQTIYIASYVHIRDVFPNFETLMVLEVVSQWCRFGLRTPPELSTSSLCVRGYLWPHQLSEVVSASCSKCH